MSAVNQQQATVLLANNLQLDEVRRVRVHREEALSNNHDTRLLIFVPYFYDLFLHISNIKVLSLVYICSRCIGPLL